MRACGVEGFSVLLKLLGGQFFREDNGGKTSTAPKNLKK